MVGTTEGTIVQFYYLTLYGEENEDKISANIRVTPAWKYHALHRHHNKWNISPAAASFVAGGAL